MFSIEGAFNQEKALVGAFSVIAQLHRLIVCSTNNSTIQTTGGSARLPAGRVAGWGAWPWTPPGSWGAPAARQSAGWRTTSPWSSTSSRVVVSYRFMSKFLLKMHKPQVNIDLKCRLTLIFAPNNAFNCSCVAFLPNVKWQILHFKWKMTKQGQKDL